MSGEKLLYLGIGVVLGWLVLPMVLGMFGHKA
jgi:hypothetical protein